MAASRGPRPVSAFTGTDYASLAVMTLWFLLTACAFAAVLGALVACVDRWRESRLDEASPIQRRRTQAAATAMPAARKRAA